MGTITSGIGVISGIDTGSLIDSLIALESRPRQLVEERVQILQSQKGAFLDLNARLLATKTAISALSNPNNFNVKTVSSTDDDVITATATNSAAVGSYVLTTARLVSTHQMISQGFADSDTTPLGAGTLRFESHRARLDNETNLSQLNGQAGVQRGTVRITDRSGTSADIDLTKAVTIDEVIDAINNASGINVSAAITGDNITLTDNTGGGGNFVVQDLNNTTTAADLGITANVASATVAGTQINNIATTTQLSILNDGHGIRTKTGLDDLTITLRDSSTVNVNLDNTTTVGDVIDAINTAGAGNLTASISTDGVSLRIVDNTGASAVNLSVAAANSSNAGADLGIIGSSATGDLDGDRAIANIGSKLVKNLRGGSGIGTASGAATLTTATQLSDFFSGAGITTNSNNAIPDILIQDRTGATYDIEVDGLSTVQDLIDAFNTATSSAVTLQISGQSLRAVNTSTGSSNFQIQNQNGASVATELGIEIDSGSGGADAITGTDTSPSNSDTLAVTARNGTLTNIDLSSAQSITDVIDTINNASAGVTASLNTAGNGIAIKDTTGGSNNLIITGGVAADLGIITAPAGVASSTLDGDDIDFRYISESTLITDLVGKSFDGGKFTITDSAGNVDTIDLSQDEKTVGDILAEINSRPNIQVTASINSTGDGITLTDTSGGATTFKVTESGSNTAAVLGLLGSDADSDGVINGTLERTIDILATDTLEDIAQKINDADVDAAATIINDGTGGNAFRLNIASTKSGVEGRLLFDDGGLGLNASTLVKGEDAVVLFGSADPTQSLLITSSVNTLTDTIKGVTLDLNSASNKAVEITVARDDDAIVSNVDLFVDAFNQITDTINKYDTFDEETETRGLLLGDGTVSLIQRRLLNLVNKKVEATGQYTFLTQLGLRIGNGSKLQFDKEKFSDALVNDIDSVISFFTALTEEATPEVELPEGVTIPINPTTQKDVGFAKVFSNLLDSITDGFTGTLTRKTNAIDAQVESANRRIEQLNTILENRRLILERQFNAMENALADIQNQASALQGLSVAALNV